MNNENLARTICEELERGSPLVLASILGQQGSSPRHTGAKMVIGAGGKTWGTIGGSLLEAGVIEEARSILGSGQSRLMEFDMTGQDLDTAAMICGGKATVMLDCVSTTGENLDFFRSAHKALVRGDDFTFLTLFKGDVNAVAVISRCLLFPDGKVTGHCPLPAADLKSLVSAAHHNDAAPVIPLRDWRAVLEPVRRTKTLYCFGAGHVAVPTAHIAALAGFRVVVVDDRAEFSNTERFPDARDVRVIDDFSHALEGLDIDADSYIVIFTRGHLYDRLVLEQALKTGAGYIGMIASRKKRDAIYGALLAKGFRKKELERVHSPIGLGIGAETPEEIAISIVAELVGHRSGQRR